MTTDAPQKPATPSPSPNTGRMPPGMVMGPDGKPCKVCTSRSAFRNWRPGTTNNTEVNREQSSHTSGGKDGSTARQSSAAAVTAALASGTAAAATSSALGATPPHCPADVEELGRATWTFLHTTAAYYPERPTPNQRANMLSLIRSLPVLYPCSHCAQDFGEDMKVHPPDVSGRLGLSRWLCERHNEVNQKLGKEKFDCATVDERWKDGPADGSCD